GFERVVSPHVYAELASRAEAVNAAMWKQEPVETLLSDLGRRMGDVFVGDQSTRLLGTLDAQPGRFRCCAVAGQVGRLADLPWELMVLPGHDRPLLFHPQVKGSFDFVRYYPSQGKSNDNGAHKILAAWALVGGRELTVEQEMQNLRRRFATRSSFR